MGAAVEAVEGEEKREEERTKERVAVRVLVTDGLLEADSERVGVRVTVVVGVGEGHMLGEFGLAGEGVCTPTLPEMRVVGVVAGV